MGSSSSPASGRVVLAWMGLVVLACGVNLDPRGVVAEGIVWAGWEKAGFAPDVHDRFEVLALPDRPAVQRVELRMRYPPF